MTVNKLTFFEAYNIVEQHYNIVTDVDMKARYWDSFFNDIDNISDEIIRKEIFNSEKEI